MHNDPQNDGGLPLPFPDALQEFRVATSGLSAQNGMHVGRLGERGDQVGHQRVPRQRVRVPARQAVQRDEPVCGRSGRTASGWTTGCGATSSAARSAGRSSGTGCSSSAATRAPARASDAGRQHRLRADGRDAGRRLHGVRLAGVQQRPPDHAARAVRQQPHRSGAVQSGGAEPRRRGCRRRPIRAARRSSACRTTATRGRRSAASTIS